MTYAVYEGSAFNLYHTCTHDFGVFFLPSEDASELRVWTLAQFDEKLPWQRIIALNDDLISMASDCIMPSPQWLTHMAYVDHSYRPTQPDLDELVAALCERMDKSQREIFEMAGDEFRALARLN